jgi:hypothetical protein
VHGPAARRRAAVALLGVIGLVPVLAARATAQTVPAAECCPELLFPIGARAVGLGNALASRSGAESLFVNPALIADVESDQFLVHNLRTDIENSNTFSLFVRSDLIGSMALSWRLIDYGDQISQVDPGQPQGVLTLRAHVLTASYATEVVAGINAGVSYKLYQFRSDCQGACQSDEFTATTHGLDIGIQFRPRFSRSLQLGASVLHLGFPLQVVNAEQASPSPVRLNVGAAWEAAHHFTSDSTIALWISGDAVVSPREGSAYLNGGAELSLDETIFLRAGYGGDVGFGGGPAVGVGLRYDRFDIGIAKSFRQQPTGSDAVQITFAIRF